MRTPIALPLIALPLIALAACAQTPAQTAASAQRQAVNADKLAAALAGLVPDKPTTCLPLTTTQQAQTQAYGNTILYRYTPSLVYRSDTAGGCDRIARGDVLVTRQIGGQLCSGDIATTVDPVARIQTGSCAFGPFTRYSKP